MRSFRGLRYVLAPPWLTGKGDGEKVAFTLEWLLDAWLERLRQGLNARFPTRAGESALGLIIGDRGLLRGRSETAAAVATRLKAWRTPRTHRVRGNAFEALLQVWHYWGGIYAATIDSHGLRHEIAATNTPDADTLANPSELELWQSGGNCAWDGTDADVHWSRFWLVLRPTAAMGFSAQPDFGDPALWGGAVGTPGYLLGQIGATAEDVSAMRALFQELAWGPAHARPEWVILALEPGVQPNPAPDGNWQYWSKDSTGIRVPARVTTPLQTSDFNTSAAAQFQNGTAPMSVPLPSLLSGGELLVWHEAQNGATFTAPPTGWTLVTSGVASSHRARLLVRDTLAEVAEGGSVAYTPTGADDHAVRVIAIAAPPGGWNPDALVNVGDTLNITQGNGSGPAGLPDSAEETHRVAFLSLDYFDVSITVSPNAGTYEEIYDSADELNLSAHHTTNAELNASVTVSTGEPDRVALSFRLLYNLGYRFWSLDPAYNNTYAGERARPWPAGATLPDGSTYNGDRSNATAAFAAITLPNGSVYAGSRARFPARVLLLDDGSVVK